MRDILLSVAVFFVTAILHVIMHRVLKKFRIVTFKTTLVFTAGFILNLSLLYFFRPQINAFQTGNLWWFISTPLSALAFYVCFSFVYVLFFTSPYWGEESPSFRIFFLIKKFGQMSQADLLKYFSNEDFIQKRLQDLELEGFTGKKGDKYYLEARGRGLLNLIETYRKILNWYPGG